jgi:hypothetical protein
MAQLWRDFTEYSVGASVGSGIDDIAYTRLDSTDPYGNFIIETGVSPSGRAFQIQQSGFSNAVVFFFPELDLSKDHDIYLLKYGAATDRSSVSGVPCLRHVGDQAFFSGLVYAGGGTNMWPIIRHVDVNAAINLQNNSADLQSYAGNENRLRVEETRVRDVGGQTQIYLKTYWADDASYLKEYTVSTALLHDTAGRPGFGVRQNSNQPMSFAFIGIGTDGDPAPTAPLRPSRTPFFLYGMPSSATAPGVPTSLLNQNLAATSFRAAWTAPA